MKNLVILMGLLLWVLPLYAQEPEDLTETYENGTFSIQYPAGWVWVEGAYEGMILFNNAQLSIEEMEAFSQEGNLPEGTLLGVLFLPEHIRLFGDLPETTTLQDFYQNYYDSVCHPVVLFCDEPTPLEWQEGEALSYRVEDSRHEGLIIMAKVEDVFFMMSVTMHPETLETYAPTLIAMFQSIEYTPLLTIAPDPALEQLEFSESHEQSGITFGYAGNWAVTTNSVDGLPVIASNPSRLTRDQGALLGEDEFLLRVYPPENLGVIEAGTEPIEALTFLLDLDESQANGIERVQLGDFPAARITQRQREFVEIYYATQLSETCTVIFALMTHPASADKFAGMLPYWLETVQCEQR